MSDPAASRDPLIGHEIHGTYKLVQVLGQGGMAVVYLGRHVLTDQKVAIKALPPDLAAQAQVKARFIDEARTLARLEHPNIVALHNFLEEDGHLYLIMQYAEGETFDETIEREGRISPADTVAVGIETLKALGYAHERGVIHRDIKPSNIIIRGDSSVKVMDFGIAKIVGSTKLTVTGQTMGTVRFMAPEQVRGKNIDHRADLYSLGVTLYQACSGRTPFDGETHFDIMRKHLTEVPAPPIELADIPPQLNEALLRSLEKRAESRFQSADEFRRALEAVPVDPASRKLTRSVPLPAMPGPEQASVAKAVTMAHTSVTATPPSRGKRLGLQVGVAVALLLLATGAVLWALFTDDGKPRRPKHTSKPLGAGTAVTKPKPLRWPKLHRVARSLKFSVDQRFEVEKLRVVAERKIDPRKLADFYARARKAYVRFLREEGIDLPVHIGPLNLVLTPQELLNSPKHWPDVKPNVDVPTRYQPPSATLYVRDGKGFMTTDLPYGLALHFCVRMAQLSNRRCSELAEGFERYLRQRGSASPRKER